MRIRNWQTEEYRNYHRQNEKQRRILAPVNCRAVDKKRNQLPSTKARKRKWQRDNYDSIKSAAHRKVRTAIKNGILVVPMCCESCGLIPPPRIDGRRGIQAHHHLGYDHPLDVKFLCHDCHRKADTAAKQP